jgi:hypothetical protein
MRRTVSNTVVSPVPPVAGLVNVDAATLSKRAKSNARLKI